MTHQLSQSALARFGSKSEGGIGEATDGPLEAGMQGFPEDNDFAELTSGGLPAFPSHSYFTQPEVFEEPPS
jgi:hypothetical protein